MKNLIKTVIICLVGMIMLQSNNAKVYAQGSPTVERETPSGISYSKIQEEIEKYVEEHSETMAGMSMAVYDEDGVIYTNYFGYADIENEYLVNENTVFEWGSVSKLFVWISAMQLVEQGKLDLEEDIEEYLPEDFLINLNYDKKITMLDLMNHQAGFQEMYAGVQTAYEDEVISLEEMLAKHQPAQIFEPGTVTAYSNWGAALAAYIIQSISGMDYADYVHKNILQPLGMEHTSVSATLKDNIWVKEQRENLECYDLNSNRIQGKGMFYIVLYPAGSVTGTMGDFLTFARAITPNANMSCPLFRKQETLELMYTATSYYGDSGVPNNYHGFFANHLGVETLGHGGNTFGCSSMLQFDPDSGIGMVVMTNQAHEQVFNYEMYEVIFGKFADSKLAEIEREVPQGFISSARTVKEGPFSVLGSLGILVYLEDDLDSWWYQDENYIYGGYSDQFVSTKTILMNLLCVLLLVTAGGYGLITTLCGGLVCSTIQKVINKKKGIRKKHVCRKWNYTMTTMMTVIFIDFIIMFSRLATGTISGNIGSINSYALQSAIIFVVAVLMIICLLFGVFYWMEKGITDTRREKIKYIVTASMSVIMLVNVLLFDMYRFWAI